MVSIISSLPTLSVLSSLLPLPTSSHYPPLPPAPLPSPHPSSLISPHCRRWWPCTTMTQRWTLRMDQRQPLWVREGKGEGVAVHLCRHLVCDKSFPSHTPHLGPCLCTQDELQFSEGDVIVVFGGIDETGFYTVSVRSTYVLRMHARTSYTHTAEHYVHTVQNMLVCTLQCQSSSSPSVLKLKNRVRIDLSTYIVLLTQVKLNWRVKYSSVINYN